LAKLEALQSTTPDEFLADSFLRDIVERNLEVAAQCCIDISNRIISLENAVRPADAYTSLLRMAELGVLPADFARQFAPLAGLRNILVYEYLEIDWNQVSASLQRTSDLHVFAASIRAWLVQRSSP
jgi:uncharacterized protein YutE (UPF0331/DUF86 family)